MRTGLRDEGIRMHMKSFLTPPAGYNDEVLLREINNASSETRETTHKHKEKASVSGRKVTINTVSTDDAAINNIAPIVQPLVEGL